MKIKAINIEQYYRKESFDRFTKDFMCSFEMTGRIDVTKFVEYSKNNKTKFYINCLYIIAKVVNSRDDYKMIYDYKNKKLGVFEEVGVTHYVFDEIKETCTPVHTKFDINYANFYKNVSLDIQLVKEHKYKPNKKEDYSSYFDASFMPWFSYDGFSLELPDGYLYFLPIINWGKYREENGKLMMPVSIRLNHAAADGYLACKFFLLIEQEILKFIGQ
jgi:chloramphenicol O-acetyltransferase type A